MIKKATLYPDYSEINSDDIYSGQLDIEHCQCVDEGLDITDFEELFKKVKLMPPGYEKEKSADELFSLIFNAKVKNDFSFNEPSDFAEIKRLRNSDLVSSDKIIYHDIKNRIEGAWYGRIIGCLLGKTVEGIRTDEFYPFLKESGNFPLHRYIVSDDISDDIIEKYKFGFRNTCYADKLNGMPVDDDTNYTVFYQYIVDKFGRDFTSRNIADEWISKQTVYTYFTAERVAYKNIINGYYPPLSAVYKNPYREWIGAQIRGDYFGYINPGNPEKAAEMAFRDASVSHVKNGIYGEMFASSMIAGAFSSKDVKSIILTGLSQIPESSRLYKAITDVIHDYDNFVACEDAFEKIHKRFDEHLSHHWCHTISNATIVAASLLYGNGDFDKTICLAVQSGFDTDCNGATAGSVVGIMNGFDCIDKKWLYPFNDTLSTYIFGMEKVKISDCINKTLEHIK